MGLLDRVRDHLVQEPAGPAWDDTDVEGVAAEAIAMAAAWDADPNDDRLARSRAATLGAFAAAMAESSESLLGVPGRTPPPTGVASGFHRGGRRPILVPVAAAILLAVSVGTVAASVPGGLLYGVRVASEELFLPGSPDARALAQVERLDHRLAEATAAAARGDAGAVSAALLAYADIADEAAAGPNPGPSTAAALALRIRAQQVLIETIDAGDSALGVVRERARVAAGVLLGALDAPGGGPGPVPSTGGEPPALTPPPSGTSMPGGPATTGGPATSGGPGSSARPGASASPGPTAWPGGPASSPAPPGSGGPKATSGPGGAAAPQPTASPQPAATPRTNANPSTSPGGGPGGGTGTGSTETPAIGGAQASPSGHP